MARAHRLSAYHATFVAILSICLSAYLCFSTALAQTSDDQSSGYARPKIKRNGFIEMPEAAYPVEYYFQEGKDFNDFDAHVYVEPLIRLEKTPDGKLKHTYDEKNRILILYFRTDIDRPLVFERLQKDLLARSMPVPTGTPAYRPGVLDMGQISRAWFETEKRVNVAGQLRPLAISRDQIQSLTGNGEQKIYFPIIDTEQSYEDVMSLVSNDETILFKYIFGGVRDEECTASMKSSPDYSRRGCF